MVSLVLRKSRLSYTHGQPATTNRKTEIQNLRCYLRSTNVDPTLAILATFSLVNSRKWVTFDGSIKVTFSFAVAALVVRHDQEAVDILHPVKVEGSIAFDLVTDGRNAVPVQHSGALVEVPVGRLGGAPVQALGDRTYKPSNTFLLQNLKWLCSTGLDNRFVSLHKHLEHLKTLVWNTNCLHNL